MSEPHESHFVLARAKCAYDSAMFGINNLSINLFFIRYLIQLFY